MSKGFFSNEILVLKVYGKIYCFFFLDSNGKIRQGYLKIINESKEFKIITDLKNNGIFDFIKKKKNEIDDNNLSIKNEDYDLYITKLKDKNEETNDVYNLKFEDMKEKVKLFSSKIMKKKDDLEVNIKESMGKRFKKYNEKLMLFYKKYEKMTIEDEKKKNAGVTTLINPESILKNDPKKVKLHHRNSSVKDRKVNKPLRKLNDGNFDISKFIPKRPIAKLGVPGIIGLKNIGATCYMNATLQCFSNTSKLRAYLLSKDVYKNLEQNKDSNKKLSFALAEVIKNLWEVITHRDYPPEHFKNVISEMNPLFKGIKANDPKDLILFLLENIHQELNEKPKENLKTNYVNDTCFNEDFKDFEKNYSYYNKSIMIEEFNGYSNSMTTCGYCGTTIHSVQSFNILFFPLEEIRKFMNYNSNCVWIRDCFKYYEKQNNYPSFYCNKCKCLCQSINYSKLVYAPQTLIINLNRGFGLEYNVNIQYDEYLNLREFVFALDSPYYYELTGVICHLGSNDEGGHFIAYCKNSNNCEWYKFNDQFVSKCNFSEVRNANLPYVLFYNYIQA